MNLQNPPFPIFRAPPRRVLRLVAAATLALGLHSASVQAVGLTLSEAPYVQSLNKPFGSFLDVVNFDVGAAGQVAGSGLSFDMPFGPAYLLHVSGLSLSLYDSANTPLGSWSGSSISFAEQLGAGSYRVEVAGFADGIAGGAYTLGLATVPNGVVASIPEPETWLFMIGGLALLGLRARRAAGRVAQAGSSAVTPISAKASAMAVTA